jgi:hypothetical protein
VRPGCDRAVALGGVPELILGSNGTAVTVGGYSISSGGGRTRGERGRGRGGVRRSTSIIVGRNRTRELDASEQAGSKGPLLSAMHPASLIGIISRGVEWNWGSIGSTLGEGGFLLMSYVRSGEFDVGFDVLKEEGRGTMRSV